MRGLVFANEALQAPLKTLETLELVIRLDDGGETWYDWSSNRGNKVIEAAGFLRDGAISKFLNLLPKLRELELVFRDKRHVLLPLRIVPFEYIGISLSFVLGSLQWPRLRTLTLSWVEISSDYFLDILQKHAMTLKKLALSHIHLLDYSWANMFDKIPQTINLNTLHLEGIFSTPAPWRVFDLPKVQIDRNRSIGWHFGGDINQVSLDLEGDRKYSRLLLGRSPCWHQDVGNNVRHGEHDAGECQDEQDDEIAQCVDYWCRKRELDNPPVRNAKYGRSKVRFEFSQS